jgi:hypothetical protein
MRRPERPLHPFAALAAFARKFEERRRRERVRAVRVEDLTEADMESIRRSVDEMPADGDSERVHRL